MEKKKSDTQFLIQISILGILILLLLYGIAKPGSGGSIGIGTVSASEVIPTGVPAVYGEELNLNYDYVSPNDKQLADQTISFLSNIDRSETLEGAELERYIDILYNLEGGISCEYCCGARSVIFENGEPACGCAHSYAMRGLTKYLIKNHPEMSDEEIFEEVAKWKILFFPGIMEGKAQIMEENGIEFSYMNLASNKYRGIEKGQVNGGMIGSC
jgi:hypothetical protein